MALIKCSECGAEMSDKAKACPKCGNKTPNKTIQKIKKTFFKYWYILIALLIIICIIVFWQTKNIADSTITGNYVVWYESEWGTRKHRITFRSDKTCNYLESTISSECTYEKNNNQVIITINDDWSDFSKSQKRIFTIIGNELKDEEERKYKKEE